MHNSRIMEKLILCTAIIFFCSGGGYGQSVNSVRGAEPILPGEYPWIAGIYRNQSDGKPRRICGGTLISKSYVLSAAHCFTDIRGDANPIDSYMVAAGKHYRDINIEETQAQFRKVKRSNVHDDYRGNILKFRDDIALIQVEKEFDLNENIQLASIDWKNEHESSDFVENSTAKVAAWNLTEANSKSTEVLVMFPVAYKTKEACQKEVDLEFFKQYYNRHKICAGFKSEDYIDRCSSDSGGGLYFESLPKKYYIRGIVSIAPLTDDPSSCGRYNHILFTKVSSYFDWIKDIVGEIA